MSNGSSPVLAIACLLLVSSACSKKNEIDVSSDIITGVPCEGDGDPACGEDGACVMGYCRIPCTTDDDCPQEALCIGPGPFGCQLTWDAFCNLSQPCKDGLKCAAKSCRMPCSTTDDCPRTDHECVDGACFGEMENPPDAGTDGPT
jgi:hypothetical protein